MQKIAEKVQSVVVSRMIRSNTPIKTTICDYESVSQLRIMVDMLAVPRDMHLNKYGINYVATRIRQNLDTICDYVETDSPYENIVAGWGERDDENKIIIGCHYDGPGASPGADDNASAIAVILELAFKLAEHKPKNVQFVFFTGEEHGLLGSRQFVERIDKCVGAVILEMVGYFTDKPNTQKLPPELQMPGMDVGNFLAIIGNKDSKLFPVSLLDASVGSALPVKSVTIPFGLEKKMEGLKNVLRSDHAPFWDKGFPAVMLTDTAEFRNPNYHKLSDTPDTLDYVSMSRVASLLHSWLNVTS